MDVIFMFEKEERIEKLYELLEKINTDFEYECYYGHLKWALFQLENNLKEC